MKTSTFIWMLLAVGAFAACQPMAKHQNSENHSEGWYQRPEKINTAQEAIDLLISGNKRFAKSEPFNDDLSFSKRKYLIENGQKPFAVIITCSDSRVPPELIFDQGLGDLFVIRVAGNIVDSVGMGSIQYAVEHLHVPLVVVLGHEKCGAVHATVESSELPGSLPSIAHRILPSVQKVKSLHPNEASIDEWVTDENIALNVSLIKNDALLSHVVENSSIKVIGAKYLLETGTVVLQETITPVQEHHQH